jgi:hypothetical protein
VAEGEGGGGACGVWKSGFRLEFFNAHLVLQGMTVTPREIIIYHHIGHAPDFVVFTACDMTG